MNYQPCLWDWAKDQFLERSGSPCGSAVGVNNTSEKSCGSAVTDTEREVSSVLLACDIADFAGRIGTGMKIGRIMNSCKEAKMKMRLTGHLGGHLLGDGVVHVLPLASHHIVDIPLADKDDEDPNSLQR